MNILNIKQACVWKREKLDSKIKEPEMVKVKENWLLGQSNQIKFKNIF